MKVRILSGNQTGHVVEMQQIEGEIAVSTGFAELVKAESSAEVAEAETEMEAVMAAESDAAMTDLVNEQETAERSRRRRH